VSRHMYFHREIDQLKKMILQQGTLVEDRLRRACTLLETRDEAQAQAIMVADWEIDDMEIRVDHGKKFAEPLTYQDQKGRKVVYPEPGKVNLTVKNELVTYLDQWLTEMINDGYRRN